MLFVKSEDLKAGMRLARPIYNKQGVLLYDRNTKLSEQGIKSVANFGIIGIYILEPAEPVPPMTEADIEFERFQTVAVFAIKEDMQALLKGEEPKNIINLANNIIRNYGKLFKKVTFIQNLRSSEDYVYKHSLNVAILCALISHRMKLDLMTQLDTVMAALLHDIGKLRLTDGLASKNEPDEEDWQEIKKSVSFGYGLLSNFTNLSPGAKRIVSQSHKEIYGIGNGNEGRDKKLFPGTKVLMVADAYDSMTAMKMDESPMSEIMAIRTMLDEEDYYDVRVVNALMESINIMPPGACVELSNGEKGLVIKENDNPLEPLVLTFGNNTLYDMSSHTVKARIQIRDIMKTMDNRIVIDKDTLEQYKSV